MNTIVAIIDSLTTEEKQHFLLFQRKKNRRSDVKNEKLFRLLDSGEYTDLDIKLYGKPSKNAYHALCKRLQDNLIDFMANQSFSEEASDEMDVLKLVLASRIFFERKKYKVAFKILQNAEKIALRTDVYSILNEVYHTKIQYAHLNANWSLPKILLASKQNMRAYQQDFQLNTAYALIKSELRNPDNEKPVKDIIEATFSAFKIEASETLTFKSLYQLMEITVTAAKLQGDYFAISPVITSLYELIRKKGIIQEKHRFYHINILNLLAVTHLRNKRFRDSQAVAAQMEREMKASGGTYYKQFREKLTIIKAFNHNYTGNPDKALELLSAFTNDSYDIHLIKVMCLMQQSNFTEAYKKLILLNHSDTWYEKKMGLFWVLKRNILEILLLMELDKQDLVFLRLERFKYRFSDKLKVFTEQRVLTFISLITRYYERPKEVISIAFAEEVEKSFYWLGREQEDIFVMSFYAWLKAKMVGRDIYQVTLELVGAGNT